MEKTLVLIKPDGIRRGLVGEIISFYERKNLEVAELRLLKASKKDAKEHYEEHRNKPFFNELIEYLTSGKLCALIIEGENAVNMVRKINGNKDPLEAEMGSIRGTYACSKAENLVHASDSIESAAREISIWFPNLD